MTGLIHVLRQTYVTGIIHVAEICDRVNPCVDKGTVRNI